MEASGCRARSTGRVGSPSAPPFASKAATAFLIRAGDSTLKTLLALAALLALLPAAPQTSRPLTLYLENDPSSLNTILNTPFGWLAAPFTQGYLFLVDDAGRLVPDRALVLPTRENGGISADGRTIVYKIRTGRWSDGAPFDSSDVAFTVAALRNPRTNVPDRSTIQRIASVAAPRPDTLVVRLKAPCAPFVSAFLTLGADDPFAILPRHVAARYADLNRSSLDERPVGLGPFVLRSWRRGDRLVFERNPYYWRGPAGVARVDVLIEPNAESRLLEARTGNLDATYLSGLQVEEAKRAGLRVVLTTTNIVDYLQFNLRDPRLAPGDVRRALSQALDRNRLAQTVYAGLEVPTDTGQLDPAISRGLRLPPYAPERARRTLAPLALKLEFAIAGQWRSSSSAALQLAAQLERAGVTATLHSYSESVFWGAADAGGILDAGRFDVALTSWSPGVDPDRSYLFGCAAVPPRGGNAGAYCSPAFDRAEADGMSSYTPARRTAAYRRAHGILVRDVPVVPIGFERSAYAVSARFEGFKPNVLGRDYWNAWEWRLSGR